VAEVPSGLSLTPLKEIEKQKKRSRAGAGKSSLVRVQSGFCWALGLGDQSLHVGRVRRVAFTEP
jgi:hypothetical protein